MSSIARYHRQDFGYSMSERMAAAIDEAFMDDAYDEETGLLNVYTPHWVELTLGKIDREAIRYFAHGACALLALEMHRLTGMPLVTFQCEGNDKVEQGEFVHAAILMHDGLLVDIEGPATAERMIARYDHKCFMTVHENEESYLAVTGDDFDAFTSYELAAAHEFALTVLKKHNISVTVTA